MLRTYELLCMLGYAMYVKRLAALHNSEKLERDVSVGVKQWLKHPEQIVFVYTYIDLYLTYTYKYGNLPSLTFSTSKPCFVTSSLCFQKSC